MRTLVVALLSWAAVARADTLKPAQRAKAIVDAQVAAMVKGDMVAEGATFESNAILLLPFRAAAVKDVDFEFELLGSPHSSLTKLRVVSTIAGGTSTAVWWTAELDATIYNHEPEETPRTNRVRWRLTELATAGSGWKVVAAAIDSPVPEPSERKPGQIPEPTDPGPLAPLLADPTEIAKHFAADPGVFVIGTAANERGLGPKGAKKLLASWAKLKLRIEGKPHAVATKEIAFALANVSWIKGKHTYPMRALVIAVADGKDWRVVAVHYSSSY